MCKGLSWLGVCLLLSSMGAPVWADLSVEKGTDAAREGAQEAPQPRYFFTEEDDRAHPGFYGSIQFMLFGWHPGGGSMPQHYPLKVDPTAHLMILPGVTVELDYSLDEYFLIRFAAAYYYGCTGEPAGYLHAGIRIRLLNRGNHKLMLGIGPTFLFRETWWRYEEYDGRVAFPYKEHAGWEYMFLPYGGDIAYLYRFKEGTELVVAMIPGLPSIVSFKAGLRWRF